MEYYSVDGGGHISVRSRVQSENVETLPAISKPRTLQRDLTVHPIATSSQPPWLHEQTLHAALGRYHRLLCGHLRGSRVF